MKNLFVTLTLSLLVMFSFYSCADDHLDAETSIVQVESEIEEIEIGILEGQSRCGAGLDFYIDNHLIPKGTTSEDGCRIGICTALYDLANYYETEPVNVITSTTFNPSSTTDEIYTPGTFDINTTTYQVLTASSRADALSYLSTIQDNIVVGDPHYSYWYAFYHCYKNQLPFRIDSSIPFSAL